MNNESTTLRGEVVSVNISKEKGTIKEPVAEITICDKGVESDAHIGSPIRQVSILAQESVDRFAEKLGRQIKAGEFAENLTIRGLDLLGVSLLDRFTIGDVELEVTQIGKKCHGEGCAIFQEIGQCIMPKEGIFCRVIETGTVKPDDEIVYSPRVLKFEIITLSDRASAGEYEDLSGPKIRETLDNFFAEKRWRIEIGSRILPDDSKQLEEAIASALDDRADVIITTGGTGVGPRDIAPDVVEGMCDKLIPGIMEQIRIKYGSEKPNALLSRGVAGVIGRTIIYTLPGSVRAVTEYMEEILKTIEHLIVMLHGFGH